MNKLIDFGKWFIKSLVKYDLLTQAGVNNNALNGFFYSEDLYRFHNNICRKSIGIYSKTYNSNNIWLLPSEHLHTYFGLADGRLMHLNRAIKYALLANFTPLVVIPSFCYKEPFPPDNTLSDTATYKQQKLGIDPPCYYLQQVLSWLNSFRDLIIDGKILLTPSVPWYEISRHPNPLNIGDDQLDDLCFKEVTLNQIAPQGMLYLCEIMSELNRDNFITPIDHRISNSFLTSSLRLKAEILLSSLGGEINNDNVKTIINDEIINSFTNPEESRVYAYSMCSSWLNCLQFDMNRIASESITFKSPPVFFSNYETQLLNLFLETTPSDTNLELEQIDILTSIDIPNIDKISITDAAEISSKYPSACTRLGLSMQKIINELSRTNDPKERKYLAKKMQIELIDEPLFEINSKLVPLRNKLKRELMHAALKGIFCGSGLAVSTFCTKPSLEILFAIFSGLTASGAIKSIIDNINDKEEIEYFPGYAIYQIGKYAKKQN